MTARYLTDDMTSRYDVDPLTGFMPRQPPLPSLPASWDAWETVFRRAVDLKLTPGDASNISEADKMRSADWREELKKVWNVFAGLHIPHSSII
jgi:hypothetical protein